MIDLSKRYKTKRDNDPPNLGNFINWHIQQGKIKKKDVSTFLGVLPTTLNKYFKQSSFQFIILWRISHAVNHNFLMELGENWLKIDYTTQKEKDLMEQLAKKEEVIKTLNIQLEAYKIVAMK
jgi:hypothetical protein